MIHERRVGDALIDLPSGIEVHVIPSADIICHVADGRCICGPTSELVRPSDGSDGWMYTHRSLDGRELAEVG